MQTLAEQLKLEGIKIGEKKGNTEKAIEIAKNLIEMDMMKRGQALKTFALRLYPCLPPILTLS